MGSTVQRTKGRSVLDALAIGGVDLPTNVTFTIASGASNVSEITMTLTNVDGGVIDETQGFSFYISDSSAGAGLTAETQTVAITGGFALGALTDNKAYNVVSDADGEVTFTITDASKSDVYICAIPDSTGKVVVSRQLTASDYGA